MNASLLGAVLLALVAVLLLVRADHPALASDPDDITRGLRALGAQLKRVVTRDRTDALVGEDLIDAIGAMARRPHDVTPPRRPLAARPVLAIRFRR